MGEEVRGGSDSAIARTVVVAPIDPLEVDPGVPPEHCEAHRSPLFLSRMLVELLTEAESELHEAVAWYMERSWQTARAFFDDYVHAETLVSEGPHRWREIAPGIRRLPFRKFPYSLIYSVVEPGHALVLAVAHQRRRPGYWRRRLRSL